ncbi:cysteine hydrolase family protein [Streptomyces griseus]|uniref:Cysteine hydrolase family protein n=1 Tax=Streptomyces stephensoniae TaxID=3375367 RepID=A0ABU2VY39_9ACTN|nr:cysteine hydrolase family protein [Streptomyces griseus]MDT0490006.1 cysteine hydrolase family protein [Streptomyces griseus]
MTAPGGTALVVVDLQNDFCAGPLAASRYPGDPARLERVVANTSRAVAAARARGAEAVFVRFLGDARHQKGSWRRRDAALGKRPKCLEGSWGAEFAAGVEPEAGEAVFTKRACFDAFLAEGFERYLVGRGVQHLVFAGLFADVCVDSTARTAFQKGFHITVLRDCTTGLHLPDEQILGFMGRLYGARITTGDQAEVWSRGPGEEEEACRTPPSRTVASPGASV